MFYNSYPWNNGRERVCTYGNPKYRFAIVRIFVWRLTKNRVVSALAWKKKFQIIYRYVLLKFKRTKLNGYVGRWYSKSNFPRIKIQSRLFYFYQLRDSMLYDSHYIYICLHKIFNNNCYKRLIGIISSRHIQNTKLKTNLFL